MGENKKNEVKANENSDLTLVSVDSPDDFQFEGQIEDRADSADRNPAQKNRGDDAYVTIDNPDDFE